MMTKGEWIEFNSLHDGFNMSAWRVLASGERRGGVILLQEIFGVTEDLKRVCSLFADKGYDVICPSMFDRAAPGVQIDPSEAGAIDIALGLAKQVPFDQATDDVQSCIELFEGDGPVFITGFCWGGSLTWLASSRCDGLNAASSFYGRYVPEFPDEQPRCPILFHFGRNDVSIPMEAVETFMANRPELPVHIYEAGHGFVAKRQNYDEESASLAIERTHWLFAANE